MSNSCNDGPRINWYLEPSISGPISPLPITSLVWRQLKQVITAKKGKGGTSTMKNRFSGFSLIKRRERNRNKLKTFPVLAYSRHARSYISFNAKKITLVVFKTVCGGRAKKYRSRYLKVLL